MDEVATNPTEGLPRLLCALDSHISGKALLPEQQQSMKRNVPRIFELLATSMESMREKNSEQVLVTCAVIERCATFHNEQASPQPTIAVEHLKQCQRHLVALLREAQETGASTYQEEKLNCEESSVAVRAIAVATIALFNLDSSEFKTGCKQEFKNSEGVAFALRAMDRDESGIGREAMHPLAVMLMAFVDREPENIDIIIANGGVETLAPYVLESMNDVQDDLHGACCALSEACQCWTDRARQASTTLSAAEIPISPKLRPLHQYG